MLRKSAMYNLTLSTSCSGATPVSGAGTNLGGGLLGVDPSGVTPRTPEILNSLIAMTNPFDSYQQQQVDGQQGAVSTGNAGARSQTPGVCNGARNSALGGRASSTELNSPTGSTVSTAPRSVQHTRSQLIKEGLKLTLQTKRRRAGSSRSASAGEGTSAQDDDDEDSASGSKRSRSGELTIEDEERRRRRRERNKVAATKCRIKKREKTVNLVQESHILESQNQELKSQIHELEAQKNRLTDMLRSHSTTCPHGAQLQARRGSPPVPASVSVAVATTSGEAGYPSYGMSYPVTPQTHQPVPPYAYNRAASTPSSDAASYDLMDSPTTYPYDTQGSTLYSPPCRTPSDITEASSPYTRFDMDLKYNRSDVMKSTPYPARPTMYYGVTKQEVVDDPLLSDFAEGLDGLADPAFTAADPHFCSTAQGNEPFGPDSQTNSYCRPASLSLDTPPSSASLESPGSVGTPGTFQYYGSGPTQDCSYSLDNGCMA